MKKTKKYYVKIQLPTNLVIKKNKNFLLFSGPLGKNKIDLKKLDHRGSISFFINKEKQTIEIKTSRYICYNSLKSLIKNKINGVTQGFVTYLRIVGIGYRGSIKKSILYLKLGHSHDISYKVPSSVRIFLIEPTLICLFGIDKNQVTQIAATIRQMRPPSPYKGKGIRLVEEKVILKQGKQK